MAVTASDIKDCFPEFGPLSVALIDKFIAQANKRICDIQWGTRADDGKLYLVAHLLKLNQQGDGMASGPLTREKVGDVERAFGSSGILNASALGSTAYGRYFLDLQKLLFVERKI